MKVCSRQKTIFWPLRNITSGQVLGYQGTGLYTHTLLAGLKNGTVVDKDKSGVVTVKSLGSYSKEMTTELSGKLGHPQTPVIINFGKDSRLFEVR